jgi:hypothetical protein
MGKIFRLGQYGEPKEYKFKWLTYYPFICGFALIYEKAGYFDKRPCIQIKLIGLLFIHLPLDSKIYSHKSPKYGIYYHDNGLWFCIGEKIRVVYMFWDKTWIRTSYLMIDNTWFNNNKTNRDDYDMNSLWKLVIKYKYKIENGNSIDVDAVITVEEREWRYKIIKWLKFFSIIHKDLSVSLSTDIGKGRGSYKGGTTGFSVKYEKGETFQQVLERMEKKYGLYSIDKERMKKIEAIYE